ncbi:MAG: polymerase beta domain protein region [Mucilaginibacter sp.]|nr:polymerase beta domain protein region [Mucilaginibacter sp.]MDB5018359.1 polymerase beta domain protein region [Mucilaginibacter sp.]
MNNSRFGFKQGDLETIVEVLSMFPEIKKAVIFGSRAKGNYKQGSDVDIAIWTENNIDAWQLPGILNEETLLPYKFDVLDYDKIDNRQLKEHITRAGIEILNNVIV